VNQDAITSRTTCRSACAPGHQVSAGLEGSSRSNNRQRPPAPVARPQSRSCSPAFDNFCSAPAHRLFACARLRIDQRLDPVDQLRQILQAERTSCSNDDCPDAGDRLSSASHMLAVPPDLAGASAIASRPHSGGCFCSLRALDVAGCDHPGPVGHRANSAPRAIMVLLPGIHVGSSSSQATRHARQGRRQRPARMYFFPEFSSPPRNPQMLTANQARSDSDRQPRLRTNSRKSRERSHSGAIASI